MAIQLTEEQKKCGFNYELTEEQIKHLQEYCERVDKFRKENTVDKIDIRLGVNGKDVIISTDKEFLIPRGKVVFKLDNWLKIKVNDSTKEQEFIVSFYMKYVKDNGVSREERYYKCYTREEINSVKLVNEIVDKAKILLNKEGLTLNDFKEIKGYGEIVYGVDENNRRYWELSNIELHKNQYIDKNQNHNEKSKKSIDKDYFDLTENDENRIIDELGIDITTSEGDTKKEIISMFCKNHIDLECFMYSGYNFPYLSAWFEIKNNKLSIYDIIEDLSIKPRDLISIDYSHILIYEPNERFYFKRWVDYLILLISFIEYIESIQIEGVWVYFDFSPFDNCEYIEVSNDLKVKENVRFTKELFHYDGVIS